MAIAYCSQDVKKVVINAFKHLLVHIESGDAQTPLFVHALKLSWRGVAPQIYRELGKQAANVLLVRRKPDLRTFRKVKKAVYQFARLRGYSGPAPLRDLNTLELGFHRVAGKHCGSGPMVRTTIVELILELNRLTGSRSCRRGKEQRRSMQLEGLLSPPKGRVLVPHVGFVRAASNVSSSITHRGAPKSSDAGILA